MGSHDAWLTLICPSSALTCPVLCEPIQHSHALYIFTLFYHVCVLLYCFPLNLSFVDQPYFVLYCLPCPVVVCLTVPFVTLVTSPLDRYTLVVDSHVTLYPACPGQPPLVPCRLFPCPTSYFPSFALPTERKCDYVYVKKKKSDCVCVCVREKEAKSERGMEG